MKASVSSPAPPVVCFPFYGDELGGSHISAVKLLQNLDPKRFRPLVVLHRSQGPVAELLLAEGVDYVSWTDGPLLPAKGAPSASSILAFVTRTLPAIRNFIKRNDVRLVHTNDGRMHTNWGLAARLSGTGLVWHHRGDPTARGVNYLAPLLAHHLITVSEFARPSRPILPVANRSSVIHSPFERVSCPIGRDVAKARLLAELELPASTRVLGYFGAFTDRKRPLAFVDIVHRFAKTHPEIPVIGCLFGGGTLDHHIREEATRRRAAQLGLEDRIRVLGFRSPVEPWLSASDVLVVPAVNEPFGRTLIEAMFLGTPVVAANHGGNPEAICDGKNGFLVPADDLDAFVEPIHRLLCDAALHERIARQALQGAMCRYGVDIHVDSVARVYDRVLRGARQLPTRDADVAPRPAQ